MFRSANEATFLIGIVPKVVEQLTNKRLTRHMYTERCAQVWSKEPLNIFTVKDFNHLPYKNPDANRILELRSEWP